MSLTELLQVGWAGGRGHGRDGHQRAGVASQRPTESLSPEVHRLGVHALFQEVQVGLEQKQNGSVSE